MHDDGTLKLRLSKHANQVCNLLLGQVLDAQFFDAIEKAHRLKQLNSGALLNLSLKDVLLEHLANRPTLLLNDSLGHADEDLLSDIDHLVLVDVILVIHVVHLAACSIHLLIVIATSRLRKRSLGAHFLTW